MGWTKLGHPSKDCGCCVVATVNFTVNGCFTTTGGITHMGAGIVVTATQGASTVTATTNSSGVAAFSLPSTGTWNFSVPAIPTSGFLATNGNRTIAAGANTSSITMTQDNAGNWVCIGCSPDADNGPYTVTIVTDFGTSTTVTTTLSTSNPSNGAFGSMTSPWMLFSGFFYLQLGAIKGGLAWGKSGFGSYATQTSFGVCTATSSTCYPYTASAPDGGVGHRACPGLFRSFTVS